jgi:LacI family transcriptional regulator
MDSRRYTISDIARKAGVGVGTVSRVLNNDPNVKEQTRQKVRKVIEHVGYQPSFAARSLRTQKSQTIGFIADAVATTPFAGNLIKGAQDAAWEKGKLLLIVDANNDPKLREKAIESMIEREVEGVIYAAMFHQEVQLPETFKSLPHVLVDCFSPSQDSPSVVPDEFQGGKDATLALLAAKHKRIGFISVDKWSLGFPASIGRLNGYKAALKEYHLAFDESLIREGDGGSAASGYAETLELMKLKNPPTAIFCGNDRIAMGAYDALKYLGLKIPQDVSVIGFDNQEVIAAYLHPALSTMALPHYHMGQWAVHHLLNPKKRGIIQQLLPCPFIERASIQRLKA